MLINIIILLCLSILILFFFIRYNNKKVNCPNCKSENVVSTGKKKYKEEPKAAVFGSPDSYNQIEYKCNKCGNLFGEKKKAVLFS